MQQQRKKFKKSGPLFDEKAYRASFYDMVLELQPLFAATESEIQEFAREPSKDLLGSILQLIIEQELRKKIGNPNSTNSSQNLQTSCEDARKNLKDFLTQINEMIDFVGSGQLKKMVQVLGIEVNRNADETETSMGMMNKKNDWETNFLTMILKLLQEIRFLIELPENPDDFKQFYEINNNMSLKSLFSKDKESMHFLDAVIFSKKQYELLNNQAVASFFKKKKIKVGKKTTEEFAKNLKEITEELLKKVPSFFDNILEEEKKIKGAKLQGADLQLLSENIYHEFQKGLESEEIASKIKEKRENIADLPLLPQDVKKLDEIKKFTTQQTTAYMSNSSMGDYEKYMDEYVSQLKFIGLRGEYEGLAYFVNKKLDKTTEEPKEEKSREAEKSIISLFLEIQHPDRLKTNFDSKPIWKSSQDKQFENQIIEKLKTMKIRIEFVDGELPTFSRSNKMHSTKTSIPESVYYCSFRDGLHFINSKPNQNYKLFRGDLEKKLENRCPVSEESILIKTKTSEFFNMVLHYLDHCCHGISADFFTKKFKACFLIYSFDQEANPQRTLDLSSESIEKFIDAIMKKDNKFQVEERKGSE